MDGQSHLPDAPPDEGCFQCLPECGLCCSYQVTLTPSDRKRLGGAGRESFWEATDDGRAVLRREGGFCRFLDHNQRCTAYEDRPAQCRAYPYLPSPYEGPEVDVDLSCPGLGQGVGKPPELRSLPEENPETERQRLAALTALLDLLRGRQLFAAGEVLVACGRRLVDELAQGWPAARRVGQALGPLINLEADEAAGSWERLSLALAPAPPAAEDPAFLEHHFGLWRWNTRFVAPGRVARYRFRWEGRGWQVEWAGGEVKRFLLMERPWGQGGLEARRAYLLRWLKRQLPVRLAHHTAAASPWPMHAAAAYVGFLAEVDRRVQLLSEAVAGWEGTAQVASAHVWEAVRGGDGLLRAWCQGARTGVPAVSPAPLADGEG